MEVDLKTCSICKERLPKTSFYKAVRNSDGLETRCKPCKYDQKRQQRVSNPSYRERENESRRKWRRDKGAEKNKWDRLNYLYGLTKESYHNLLELQNSACAICKTGLNIIHVDHCHTTGVIRGLLCPTCNTGLGKFKDNLLLLQNAIDYLRKNTADDASY